jgi:IS4 transposase
LVLREVRYGVGTPGFRTRQIILVTTLLDPGVYRVADLAERYRQRWQVETSLAHLKTTMHIDVLHCKSVSGVLKELTIFAIVYNLVRLVMRHQRHSNTSRWSGSASWTPCGGSARPVLADRWWR